MTATDHIVVETPDGLVTMFWEPRLASFLPITRTPAYRGSSLVFLIHGIRYGRNLAATGQPFDN